jgi:protein subunit release factor A
MFEKLLNIEKRYEEVTKQLQDSKVINNQDLYRDLMKEINELEPIIVIFRHIDMQKKLMKNLWKC